MSQHSEFRQLLEQGDAKALVDAWGRIFPGMPTPESVDDAAVAMHVARTAADTLHLRLRAYSHAWLLERGYPSQLPDELKPKAERIYPIIVDAVGISVGASSDWLRPAADEIRESTEYAVEDCYANGDKDPGVVSVQMAEARERAHRQLFGRLVAGRPHQARSAPSLGPNPVLASMLIGAPGTGG